MKKIVFIFSTIILCSYKEPHVKSETGFSKICLELANKFTKYDHGNLVYNQTENKYIQPNNLAEILLAISKHDLEETENYKVERKNSEKLEQTKWTDKTSKNIIRIEKIVFKATGVKCKGIIITDYKIHRKATPNYIHLRLIESEFEELTIDTTKYHSFFESRLLGADEAIEELKTTRK